MFNNAQEVLDFIKREEVVDVDFKTIDLFGRWHHLTFPARRTDGAPFVEGFGFDGSSYGFKKVDRSDMIMLPDLSTGCIDPFFEARTLSFIADIHLTDDEESRYPSDPRFIAEKAEKYLTSLGVGDRLVLGPEFEFYVFDSVAFANKANEAFFAVDACQASWNSGDLECGNSGYQMQDKAGYHAAPPLDTHANFRSKLCRILDQMGVEVKYHHHEVGGIGQQEIEVDWDSPRTMADKTMVIKYAAKNFALSEGKSLTFMPKPLHGQPGNGMHVHFKLYDGETPVFSDEHGYSGLSQTALHFIAGILKHSPALLGLTNPSTNSYKRLVPGYEAPVSIAFATANRSAAIRVPGYVKTPDDRRFEFRTPDATCNPYLAYAAIAMAGFDGIKNKLDPT
ncbi:MAG TPA: type I glutamate--ammonia ligase, partial [Chroococcales cyanobacterium]